MKDYKNKKEFKQNLVNLNAVEIYQEVLRDKYIKKFPKGFWQRPDALSNAKKVTKYLIENILHWNDEDIKNKLNGKIFINNKLYGMVLNCLSNSSYKAIDNAYPNRFKPWELNFAPRNYWNKETIKEATIWLIEEKLKWNNEDIKEKLCKDIFIDNRLYGMLNLNWISGSPFKVINITYPDKFKPWELKSASRNYWNKETAKEATKWLIEDVLHWNDEDIKKKICIKIFKDNGLYGMLKLNWINGSPFKAIDNAYPGRFKKKDLKNHNYHKD